MTSSSRPSEPLQARRRASCWPSTGLEGLVPWASGQARWVTRWKPALKRFCAHLRRAHAGRGEPLTHETPVTPLVGRTRTAPGSSEVGGGSSLAREERTRGAGRARPSGRRDADSGTAVAPLPTIGTIDRPVCGESSAKPCMKSPALLRADAAAEIEAGPEGAQRGGTSVQRGRLAPAHRHFGSATSRTRTNDATRAGHDTEDHDVQAARTRLLTSEGCRRDAPFAAPVS